MSENRTELSVNTNVLEKMAAIAAKEIEGVVSLANKAIDLKGAVKNKNAFKGVKVENLNGAIKISVYIVVDKNVQVKEVAEKVQANVKDKIQTMTGTAVTKIDVIVADVKFDEAETEE